MMKRRAVSVVLILGGLAIVACKPKNKPTDPKATPTAKAPTVGTAAHGFAEAEDENGEDTTDKSGPVKHATAKADAQENATLRTQLATRTFANPDDVAKKVGAPKVVVRKKSANGGCGEITVGGKKYILDCDEDDEIKGASQHVLGEDDLSDGAAAPVKLPDDVDFRSKKLTGPVLDQGQTGTCSAVSLAAILNHEIGVKTGTPGDVSPMQIWGRYHKSSMDEAIKGNSGKGIAPMSLLPYDPKVADGWATGKPVPVDLLAKLDPKAVVNITDVVKVELKDIKGALAQGHAVWFAIHGGHVLNSTDGPPGGPKIIPAYDYQKLPPDQKMGHAIAMVGYHTLKTGKSFYLIQNSWGPTFGDGGFAYIDEATLARNFKYAYTLEVQPIGAAKRPSAAADGAAPAKCKPGLLPDAATGKCAPACTDGSARNEGACAEADDCPQGEVNVRGHCVRAAPTIKKSKNGFALSCAPGGCVYAFAKGVAGCPREKGCVVACPAPNFKLVKRANGLACH